MTQALTPDRGDHLATARVLAGRGEWAALREWLGDSNVRLDPELAVLLAEASVRLGNSKFARPLLEKSIPALVRAGDRPAHRRAINLLGAACFEIGDLDAAEVQFARALELAHEERDPLLVARATNNLGAIANIRGRHGAALALYQLAVPAYQNIGSALGLAESFHNIAITFRDSDDLDQAEDYERRALEFAQQAGSARLVAMARTGRAELSLRRGDARLADAGATMAAVEHAAVPNPVGEADALRLVGAARAALGDTFRARHALDRALALARAHGSLLVEAEVRLTRARLAASTGERGDARTDAAAALALYQRLGAAAEQETVACFLDTLGGG